MGLKRTFVSIWSGLKHSGLMRFSLNSYTIVGSVSRTLSGLQGVDASRDFLSVAPWPTSKLETV
jgi:hypothetical protein